MLPEGLNLNLDLKAWGLRMCKRKTTRCGGEIEDLLSLDNKGFSRCSRKTGPGEWFSYVGARFTGRFAKGGKVKPYAKGGGVRKPRLK